MESEKQIKDNPKGKIKKFWNWLWNSDSLLSYIVFLIIMFIFIKFIFLPVLGLIFGSSLPLAIVESSSMDHHTIYSGNNEYEICGKTLNEKKSLNTEEYFDLCGTWYEDNTNITLEDFENFKFKNGFNKGDLIIIFGKKYNNLEIGDVIVFTSSSRPHPIIHRIITLEPISTKGDHNPGQLVDEKSIEPNQIIGVAVGRIPYVGWIKLFFYEIFS